MRPTILIKETPEEKLKRIAPELARLRQNTLERKATDIQVKQKNILAMRSSNAIGYNVMPTGNHIEPLAKRVEPLANRVEPLANRVEPLANRVKHTVPGLRNIPVENRAIRREIPGNLISPQLGNGIGNRIFQLLAALGYAEKYGKQCVISNANIQNGSKPHEKNLDEMLSRIFPNVPVIHCIKNPTIIRETQQFNYNDLPNSLANVVLQGYFQDERYFPSESSNMIPKIKTEHYPNTYFIHIRAGDYLQKGGFGYDLSYYYKSCFEILSPDTNYIVFSDDVTYATNYMKQFNISYTISNKINQLDALIEMSNCEGAICANSSFSWIGAFFQDKTKGKRFMPSQWIKGRDCTGVYPIWSIVMDITGNVKANCLLPQQQNQNRLPFKEERQERNINPEYNNIDLTNTINTNQSNKTIIHVLDLSNGFGDFLRGSILLAEYAKYYNIQFKMNVSKHNISKYLDKYTNDIEFSEPVELICFNGGETDSKLRPLIEHFLKSEKNVIYITTNLYYNISYLTEDIKENINSFFQFKQEFYDKAIMMFSLKKYNVLHIRCKDEHFTNTFDDDTLIYEIIKLQLNNDTIVISNNCSLKRKLNSVFGFHYIDNEAYHTAKLNNYTELESTIIDYIILSKSYRTYCFSYYHHGSGFSEQCSVLNNIPYSVVYLPNKRKLNGEERILLSVYYNTVKDNTNIKYGFNDLDKEDVKKEYNNISFITLTNNGYVDYTLNCLYSLEKINFKKKLKVYCIGEEGYTIFNNKEIDCELIDDKKASVFQEFRTKNWSNVTFYKFKIIYDNLLKNEYVCITDGDIVYENTSIFDFLLNKIEDNDILIQSEGIKHDDLCSGFMFIKSNQNTISLFNPSNIEQFKNTVGWDDQVYINSIRGRLKYKKLPISLFPTGLYYYEYSNTITPYLIHFNWVIGHEKKDKIIKYNKWYLKKKVKICQHGTDGFGHQLEGMLRLISLSLNNKAEYQYAFKKAFEFEHSNFNIENLTQYLLEALDLVSENKNIKNEECNLIFREQRDFDTILNDDKNVEKTIYLYDGVSSNIPNTLPSNFESSTDMEKSLARLREGFVERNKFLPKPSYNNEYINVCCHIRLGDAVGQRILDNDTLFKVISEFQKYNKYRIIIHTDGDVRHLENSNTIIYSSKTDVLQVLSDFVFADILIMTYSSLSIAAHLLGSSKQCVIYPRNAGPTLQYRVLKKCITTSQFFRNNF